MWPTKTSFFDVFDLKFGFYGSKNLLSERLEPNRVCFSKKIIANVDVCQPLVCNDDGDS